MAAQLDVTSTARGSVKGNERETEMTTQYCAEETVGNFKHGSRISKITRYGWTVTDVPGEFVLVDKGDLNIDHSYQRDRINKQKVRQIASEWSWAGCGCILVAMRTDGTFWVFDGQHRVLAAKNRADVRQLPCLVFESTSVEQEAASFLVSNAERKPVTALDKFKAMVVTGNRDAKTVSDIFEKLEIVIAADAKASRELCCVSRCLSLAQRDAQVFEWALRSTADLCGTDPIHVDILNGLFWIEKTYHLCGTKRFDDALCTVSRAAILESISKYAAAEGKRGDKVCGTGILKVLNHGRRHRFGQESNGGDE